MYADDYEQEPEQVTLTNQWLNTKKHGRDDKEIERDKKKVLADRKRARQKVFLRQQRTNANEEASPSKFIQESEVSALTQIEEDIKEVVIYHSSDDSAFDGKLVSPASKRLLHSRIEETPPAVRNKSNEKSCKRSNAPNKNPDSRLVKDLNKQIILQQNTIADLRRKMSIIRDISNDTKKNDLKQLNLEVQKIVEVEEIASPSSSSGKNVTLPSSSPGNNVMNFYFN